MEPPGIDVLYDTRLLEDDLYIVDYSWVRVLLFSVYVVVFLLGVVANIPLIVVILRKASLRSVTNILIVNLAFADIVLCVFTGAFSPLSFILDTWPFGGALCHLVPATLVVSVGITTWTCLLLAIHRFLLAQPSRTGIQYKPTSLALVALVWILAGGICWPSGVNMEHYSLAQSVNSSERHGCSEYWPERTAHIAYRLSLLCLQFVLPSLITGFCYVHISFWGRRKKDDKSPEPPPPSSGGDCEVPDDGHDFRAMRRTNRMLVVVFLIFILLWLPYNIFDLVVLFSTDFFDYDPFYALLVHLIAMCSAVYKPWVYVCMSDRLRHEFKMLLCCRTRTDVNVNSPPVSSTHTVAGVAV